MKLGKNQMNTMYEIDKAKLEYSKMFIIKVKLEFI